MASTMQFKTYARDTRVQVSEETFKGGQVFTRAPLTTEKVRLLINYDLINDGEAITPRKGYRTTMIGLPFNVSGLEPKNITDLSISLSRDAVEEDNKEVNKLKNRKITLVTKEVFPKKI